MKAISIEKRNLSREINLLKKEFEWVQPLFLSGSKYYQGEPLIPYYFRLRREITLLTMKRNKLNKI